jgi:hypothetical protein
VIIPGATPHSFENQGSVPAGFISFNSPGGFEANDGYRCGTRNRGPANVVSPIDRANHDAAQAWNRAADRQGGWRGGARFRPLDAIIRDRAELSLSWKSRCHSPIARRSPSWPPSGVSHNVLRRAVECGGGVITYRHKRCGHVDTDADPRRQDFEGAMAVPAEVLKRADRVI